MRQKSNHTAFTLTELLVVITILFLLYMCWQWYDSGIKNHPIMVPTAQGETSLKTGDFIYVTRKVDASLGHLELKPDNIYEAGGHWQWAMGLSVRSGDKIKFVGSFTTSDLKNESQYLNFEVIRKSHADFKKTWKKFHDGVVEEKKAP